MLYKEGPLAFVMKQSMGTYSNDRDRQIEQCDNGKYFYGCKESDMSLPSRVILARSVSCASFLIIFNTYLTVRLRFWAYSECSHFAVLVCCLGRKREERLAIPVGDLCVFVVEQVGKLLSGFVRTRIACNQTIDLPISPSLGLFYRGCLPSLCLHLPHVFALQNRQLSWGMSNLCNGASGNKYGIVLVAETGCCSMTQT